MTEIVELKDFIPAYTNAVQKLLEQLTNRPVKLTGTTLREIISQENTHLFFLLADQEIAGMLTVGIYHSLCKIIDENSCARIHLYASFLYLKLLI